VQIIRKNFGLKLLSLTLAIVGWAYFHYAGNPVFAARADQQISVPIVTANLPVGYIARYADKEAVVTIATRRGEPAVKPDEVKAVLDLSGKEAGVYNVPVALVAPDVVVQSLSPASVSLTIEKIEARAFPLALHYVNGVQNGMVVSSSSFAPAQVILRGPSETLAGVTGVQADITLPPQAGDIDEMVRPVPVDAQNQEVTGLDVAPDLVRVRVHVIQGTGQQK
jgi:YbbR domain-containing protein